VKLRRTALNSFREQISANSRARSSCSLRSSNSGLHSIRAPTLHLKALTKKVYNFGHFPIETIPQLGVESHQSSMRETLESRKVFIDFVRSETRFEIAGHAADEGIVRRLAAILENRQNWERFRARVREWSHKHTAYSWGIMICIAEDSIVQRPAPAQQQALPFNVRSIADGKRIPVARSPKADPRIETAFQAAQRWKL
jgi:hypothetical protein